MVSRVVGLKTEKLWGSISSSLQDVDPQLWLNHARQLMAQHLSKQVLTKVNILVPLVKVMERLTCSLPVVIGEEAHDAVPGVLEFEEAFRIYREYIITEACDIEQLRGTFQNQILHEKTGLPVVVINHNQAGKYIILKSSYFSMEFIFSTLFDKMAVFKEEPVVLEFSFSEIKSLMSTDFDRKLLEIVVAVGKTNKEVEDLGINLAQNTDEIKQKIEELRSVDESAEMKARLKLEKEISCVEDALKSNKLKLEVKRNTWPVFAIRDLEEKIEAQEKRRVQLVEIQAGTTHHHKVLFKRRVSQAKHFIIRDQKMKQIGRSKTNKRQGAKRKLTDSDDEYVASMFSEHAGYHGLRNTVTEFIGTVDRNKRIKLDDIKKYYNIRRSERGESNISTTTARRRLAPRRKKSHAAKSHIGKCLISVAVPPRTGDSANENTHFARKFRSNVEKSLFSRSKFLTEIRDIESNVKVLFKSKDDAHYVAPGTKGGFDRARQKKIFCPQDKEKRHGLPKYDFPDNTLYQTPGSHRILQKVPKDSGGTDGEEKLGRDPDWDHHHVYIRPKITQDSSGLTWSSEDIDLIINEPLLTSTVTDQECQLSKEKFSCLRAIQLELKLFMLMQNVEDEKFIDYSLARLENLKEKLKMQLDKLKQLDDQEQEIENRVENILTLAAIVIDRSRENQEVLSSFVQFAEMTEIIKNILGNLSLPPVRPIRVDMVDSGPGQAPSQKDVIFCDRLLFYLLETSYYARVSLADHDSYMNYAERTNSAISDAMCVGTSIECDVHNPLENLSVEEVSKLDNNKFKELSFQAQVKNSHAITECLVQRINGAPCLGNFITGRGGIAQEDQFLGFLKPFIQDILSASDMSQVPGGNFALDLERRAENHSTRGLLFSELAKEKCLLLSGTLCNECLHNPQKSGEKLVTVPQPEVDHENDTYLDVAETSYRDRDIDDYLPRKNLDQLFRDGKLNMEEDIIDASKKFLVDRNFVVKRIQHLKLLQLKKELRKKETESKRNDRNIKSFDDYDWEEEIERNNFKKLVVKDLKKYCEKFKLGSSGKKDDLKNRVRGHWFTGKSLETFPPHVLPTVAPQLGVVFADVVDQIVDTEDYEALDVIGEEEDLDGVASDDDDIINCENIYSSCDSDDDDDFM